jgi:hypothetical protein
MLKYPLRLSVFISSLFLIFLTSAHPTYAVLKDVYNFEPENQQLVELTPGKIIEFEFTSPVDTFGAIALKFSKPADSTDTVEFKIREQGSISSAWYHTAQVQLDQPDMYVQDKYYHPFGFPVIKNAKDKTYIVQLQTTEGKKDKYTAIYTSPDGQPIYKLIQETDAKPLILSDFLFKIQSEPIFFIFWTAIIILLIWQILKP